MFFRAAGAMFFSAESLLCIHPAAESVAFYGTTYQRPPFKTLIVVMRSSGLRLSPDRQPLFLTQDDPKGPGIVSLRQFRNRGLGKAGVGSTSFSVV